MLMHGAVWFFLHAFLFQHNSCHFDPILYETDGFFFFIKVVARNCLIHYGTDYYFFVLTALHLNAERLRVFNVWISMTGWLLDSRAFIIFNIPCQLNSIRFAEDGSVGNNSRCQSGRIRSVTATQGPKWVQWHGFDLNNAADIPELVVLHGLLAVNISNLLRSDVRGFTLQGCLEQQKSVFIYDINSSSNQFDQPFCIQVPLPKLNSTFSCQYWIFF